MCPYNILYMKYRFLTFHIYLKFFAITPNMNFGSTNTYEKVTKGFHCWKKIWKTTTGSGAEWCKYICQIINAVVVYGTAFTNWDTCGTGSVTRKLRLICLFVWRYTIALNSLGLSPCRGPMCSGQLGRCRVKKN